MKETLKLSYTKQVLIEVLNAATHGIGALLSIIATVALILKGVQHGSHLEIVSYAIYGASLFLLFLNSTLYHSFSLTRYKDVFQKIDHSSIYLLIAGTYTPYLMVSIGGLWFPSACLGLGYWRHYLRSLCYRPMAKTQHLPLPWIRLA